MVCLVNRRQETSRPITRLNNEKKEFKDIEQDRYTKEYKIFEAFIENNKQCIKSGHLKRYLKQTQATNLNITKDRFEGLIKENVSDLNRSRMIDKTEYYILREQVTEVLCKETFDKIGADKDGEITVDELMKYYKKVDGELTREQANTLIKQMNTNGNSKISLKEFKKYYFIKNGLNPIKYFYKNEFKIIDTDNIGYIDKSECKEWLKSMNSELFVYKKKSFGDWDLNNNDEISFNEFMMAVKLFSDIDKVLEEHWVFITKKNGIFNTINGEKMKELLESSYQLVFRLNGDEKSICNDIIQNTLQINDERYYNFHEYKYLFYENHWIRLTREFIKTKKMSEEDMQMLEDISVILSQTGRTK